MTGNLRGRCAYVRASGPYNPLANSSSATSTAVRRPYFTLRESPQVQVLFEMVFTIELESRKSVYSDGDVVKGNVILACGQDEPIGKVAIRFHGRAKTKISKHDQSRSKTRGRCTMFWFEKTLYVGKYTFKRGRYAWPFDFEFPMESNSGAGEQDRFENVGIWASQDTPHPLPPTYNANDIGFLQDTECFVEYKLDASLTRPSDAPLRKQFSNMETTLTLTYLPRRLEESPDLFVKPLPQSFTAKSLRLLPNRANDKLTMKEKLRSTFKSSELPTASFTVELTYPTQIYPGGPFPINLGLKGMKTSEDVQQDPPVVIKEVVIKVRAEVQCRTAGVFGDHNGDIITHSALLDTSGCIVNVELPRPNSKVVEAGTEPKEVDLTRLGKRNFCTKSIDCDFRTYNIAVDHKIDIKVKLMCVGKDFQMEVRRPLKVLPPFYGDITPPTLIVGEPSSSQAILGSIINNPAFESNELPAYEAPPPRYELADNERALELEATSSRANLEGTSSRAD